MWVSVSSSFVGDGCILAQYYCCVVMSWVITHAWICVKCRYQHPWNCPGYTFPWIDSWEEMPTSCCYIEQPRVYPFPLMDLISLHIRSGYCIQVQCLSGTEEFALYGLWCIFMQKTICMTLQELLPLLISLCIKLWPHLCCVHCLINDHVGNELRRPVVTPLWGAVDLFFFMCEAYVS